MLSFVATEIVPGPSYVSDSQSINPLQLVLPACSLVVCNVCQVSTTLLGAKPKPAIAGSRLGISGRFQRHSGPQIDNGKTEIRNTTREKILLWDLPDFEALSGAILSGRARMVAK